MFGRFDRMFDGWMRMLPFWRAPVFGWDLAPGDMIPVNEFREDDTLVVRAELPGIDPENDVELTVDDGMLWIEAERRAEMRTEDSGYVRRELRFGSLTRSLPLPPGVSEADIKADYKDGILEIRVPLPEVAPTAKVPITKS
jgi:HSP20 family protein